jgi:glyoxalase superfamily protein
MGSVFREVVIDCQVPEVVGRFWADILQWPLTMEENGDCWLSATGTPMDPPLLVFVRVPEPKSVKNRIHLDVNPSGCDQAEELERLLALGARQVDVGQGDVPWIVLADPEDNEFCLLGRRVDP